MSNRIPLTCSRCKNEWFVDLEALNAEERIIYKNDQPVKQEQYRAACPQCGQYKIITVEVSDE